MCQLAKLKDKQQEDGAKNEVGKFHLLKRLKFPGSWTHNILRC